MKHFAILLSIFFIGFSAHAQVTWKKGKSDSLNISLEYPANWSFEETEEGLAIEGFLLGNDNNKASFTYAVYPMPEGFNDGLLDLAGASVQASMTENGEFTLVDSLSKTTFKEKEARTLTLTTKAEGSTVFMVIYMFTHQNGMGVIMFGDDEKEYKASYTKYFEHMLNSVKLD